MPPSSVPPIRGAPIHGPPQEHPWQSDPPDGADGRSGGDRSRLIGNPVMDDPYGRGWYSATMSSPSCCVGCSREQGVALAGRAKTRRLSVMSPHLCCPASACMPCGAVQGLVYNVAWLTEGHAPAAGGGGRGVAWACPPPASCIGRASERPGTRQKPTLAGL